MPPSALSAPAARSEPGWRWLFVAALTASPYVALQGLYIADPSLAEPLFGYGLILLAVPAVVALWCLCLTIETVLRHRGGPGVTEAPLFSFVGAGFLVAFFLPAKIMEESLSRVPSVCRVDRIIHWEAGDEALVLVLGGPGTVDRHQLEHGYVNWTGEGPGGFTDLRFAPGAARPVRLQKDYHESYIAVDAEGLANGLSDTGLSPEIREEISADMFRLLAAAAEGRDVRPALGDAQPIQQYTDHDVITRVGGLIWIVALLGTFAVVGRQTLPRRLPAASDGERPNSSPSRGTPASPPRAL